MIELITGIVALLTTVAGIYAGVQKRRADKLQSEVEAQDEALRLPQNIEFLRKWNAFEQSVRDLLNSSEIDRFILFRCWNGYKDPKWTTAIYQIREEGQEWFNYILVPLDDDYRDRLKVMKEKGLLTMVVEELPPSMIRDVYMGEGVRESVWFHVMSTAPTERGSVAHTYFSAASHTEAKISDESKTKLQTLAWELAEVLKDEA